MTPSRLRASEGIGVFAAAALLLLLLGGPLASYGSWGLGLAEILLIAGPAMAAAAARGAGVLGLERLGGRALGGAFLVGASLWIVVVWGIMPLQEWLAPAPPELIKALEEAAAPGGVPWVSLVTAGLLPALCEELLCRGVLMRALHGRVGARWAIVSSAALFACLHLSPYRLMPTFVLGLFLGVAATVAGTWAAVVLHFTNNAAVVLVSSDLGAGAQSFLDGHGVLGPAIALVVTVCGTLILVGGGMYPSSQDRAPR